MELTLAHQTETEISVTCDGQHSHTFDVRTLGLNNEKERPHPLDDPVMYGEAVYLALFPPGTHARHGLETMPERILLVTNANDLDAISWEYAYGPDGFLVLEYHFVRGLPAAQRIASPTLDSGLHIVAVPSNPLSYELEPLDIDGEWLRLKDTLQGVPYSITLERTRPPTIVQVRSLVANQNHRVIHFMGHGGQNEQGAFLCFEQENGDLDPVTARQFALRVRGTVFLVTLNACTSATPGPTTFSNLAAALVRQKTPYALGMRFSIPDEDARAFSRVFYNDLARGSSVEEALLQARLTLAKGSRLWVIGVPVLYTSLAQPATGFASLAGSPLIKEHQPYMEVSGLLRAEGVFQGRVDELKALGAALTGDRRPPLITLHGAGGQGKTALAREAVERFAFAWPGGVWATSLENLPSRELFVSALARFLNIDTQTVADPNKVERQVIADLAQRRTLIVLDNVETLIQAVEANDQEAIRLAQFLREQLPRPPVSLLATSRSFLHWTGENGFELPGLAPREGVRLFQQHAPQREREVDPTLMWELCEKVEGHPLSLRLLGSAFNVSALSFSAFVEEYETRLLSAENKYVGVEHRQRTLYTSLETSVRYLSGDLRSLLSGLWIFHAPFLTETAAAIFDPKNDNPDGERSQIYDRLDALWRCGLLDRDVIHLPRTILLYHLLPGVRLYVEHYLEQTHEHKALLSRFGEVYCQLAYYFYTELNRSTAAVSIVTQTREDLERGVTYVTGAAEGPYLLYWGWVLQRLGDTHRGLMLTERCLEVAQGQNRRLEMQALNNMAGVYQTTGQRQRALALYEQALPIAHELADRTGEAATLNNMAATLYTLGLPQRALALYEQALSIVREIGDRTGEAAALNNMALLYGAMGQPQREVQVYGQVLDIQRELGDRTGEATALNNMAGAYYGTGKWQQALKLYQQVLPIVRELGDRAGEAVALNNLGMVYRSIGDLQQALQLYEQALPIMREVGDRAGEASVLNNMGLLCGDMGQQQQALEFYGQALSIWQEVGDQASKASTFNNMARVYYATGQPQRALELYEQALSIHRVLADPASESTVLANMAAVLYRYLNRPQEAIKRLEQAIAILLERDLPQDSSGQTLNGMRQALHTMRKGEPLGAAAGDSPTMSAEAIQKIVTNTVAVMTREKERRVAWRKAVAELLRLSQFWGTGWQHEVDFLTSVLTILDEQVPTLPAGHPYAPAVAAIQEDITKSGSKHSGRSDAIPDEILQAVKAFLTAHDWDAARQIMEAQKVLLFSLEAEILLEELIAQARAAGTKRAVELLKAHLAILRDCKAYGIAVTFERLTSIPPENLPFDAELISRSIMAFLGDPQEKIAHIQYLAEWASQSNDEDLKKFITVIQLALLGADVSQLRQRLSDMYRQAWDAIVAVVETEGADPGLFGLIIRNTLAVLGPSADKWDEWYGSLTQMKAIAGSRHQLVALLDAVIELLEAEGDPTALGGGLTGIYAQTWDELVKRLAKH